MGYTGMPQTRNYNLQIHGSKPQWVTIDEISLKEVKEIGLLQQAGDGWYFDPLKNIIHIKVREQKAKSSFSTTILKYVYTSNIN